MSYVIYSKATTEIIQNYRTRKSTYKTMSSARAAITRLSKQYHERAGSEVRNGLRYEEYRLDKDPQFIYGIAESEHYAENIERKVERVNLMTGEKYLESINTPNHCSPSSETYWSM